MNKKIVLLSNCILNNEEHAKEIVKYLAEAGIGIIQLPCPKMMAGFDIASKKECPAGYRDLCRTLSENIVNVLEKHISDNNEVLGIVGIEFSANCGVHRYSDGKKSWGKGVFFEEIEKNMEQKKIQVPFFGFSDANVIGTLKKFEILLNNI